MLQADSRDFIICCDANAHHGEAPTIGNVPKYVRIKLNKTMFVNAIREIENKF